MKRSIAWPRARSRPWNPWRARGMTMPASERARVTFRSNLSRDVGDGPEEDQPNHAPIAGAGRVVEHLVGAGGVPGKDDTAVAALDGKGDHRSDVLDALAEPLEGRAGEVLAPAGDDIVAAVVELEVRDARGVEPCRQLPDQRLPGGERRPEAVHPDERRAPPAAPRFGDDAVEPDAVASAEADERDGNACRPCHARTPAGFAEAVNRKSVWLSSSAPGPRWRGGRRRRLASQRGTLIRAGESRRVHAVRFLKYEPLTAILPLWQPCVVSALRQPPYIHPTLRTGNIQCPGHTRP